MEISPALAADLAILTSALDDPTVDLADTLHNLARAAAAAVGSYVGLSIQIMIDSRVLIWNAFEETAGTWAVRTSLRTPLPLGVRRAQTDPASGVAITLILYASTPGAFVDLAADLSWLTTDPSAGAGAPFDADLVELDGDLPPAIPQDGVTSIRDLSIVNQAIGVLIGLGHTPEQAERDLYLRAAREGVDVTTAALAVLARIGEADGTAMRDIEPEV